MGGLCSCCSNNADETNLMPSPETRRRQQLEAAERRRFENEHRGVKDLERVKQQQLRSEAKQRRLEEAERAANSGPPTLKWQSN
ncbi:small VCP/p97-interacting protein [Glossina fuscipes]|uniref:Small VCP/p97-interacting protein n=1 Tax=Glossina fuscipes TaxID=7396 RepID=A0A8U0W627_9MUSC|nr:small VCP/p97-interacting protein [Glossina fuscipes]